MVIPVTVESHEGMEAATTQTGIALQFSTELIIHTDGEIDHCELVLVAYSGGGLEWVELYRVTHRMTDGTMLSLGGYGV